MMQQQMKFSFNGQGCGFYQHPSQQSKLSWKPGASQNPRPSFHVNTPQTKPLFMETLHFPDLSRLLNDPIYHDPGWPPMLAKFPSNIPKFEGKSGEYQGDHMTTFPLWCSSNSLKDNSVQLRIFQHTLIGGATKWYINLAILKYSYFNDLVMVFLNHFHFLVRYYVGTEFMANFE
jgi:hypothetical protein